MAAEVNRGAQTGPQPTLPPPHLSQSCDRSVVQKWDLMGQLCLYFWSRLFIKKMISPTFSPFIFLS